MSENTVNVGGEVVSLADFAELDLSNISENRGPEATPAGVYVFRVVKAELTSANGKVEGKEVVKPVIKFEFEVKNVLTLVRGDLNSEDYIGKKHFETFYITDLAKDLGRVKALMTDSGFSAAAGGLRDLLMAFVGHDFIAAIKHRKDPNDADNTYANIDSKKIRPIDSEDVA